MSGAEIEGVNESLAYVASQLTTVLGNQDRIVKVLNEHSDALEKLGVKTTRIEDLSKQSVEYSQSWAGDVKRVMEHLGIETASRQAPDLAFWPV